MRKRTNSAKANDKNKNPRVEVGATAYNADVQSTHTAASETIAAAESEQSNIQRTKIPKRARLSGELEMEEGINSLDFSAIQLIPPFRQIEPHRVGSMIHIHSKELSRLDEQIEETHLAIASLEDNVPGSDESYRAVIVKLTKLLKQKKDHQLQLLLLEARHSNETEGGRLATSSWEANARRREREELLLTHEREDEELKRAFTTREREQVREKHDTMPLHSDPLTVRS